MHVLIVSQYFWPENFRINDITQLLIEKGHSVSVITGIPNYPDGKIFTGYGLFKKRREIFNGAEIFRIPLIPRGKGGGIRLAINYLSFMISGLIFSPFINVSKFDVIFVYEPSPVTVAIPAILLKKINKVPLVFYVLDLWPESISAVGAINSKGILGIIKKLVFYIYKNCDLILVPSQSYINNIRNYNVDKEKIIYWPQWGEELIYSNQNNDNNHIEKMPEGFRIIFAGNIGVAQGLDIIIDAAKLLKQYPDIFWIIIGDGRMRTWFEEQIKKHNLNNIIMLGKKPLEMMPCYFLEADCLFVSLKHDPVFSLTLPAKVQTYLAAGKPIIAAIDGEGARVIDDAKAGLTSPSNNPQKLANNILTLFKMEENKRIEMGSNGKKYFESHFKSNYLLSQLIEMFGNLKQNNTYTKSKL